MHRQRATSLADLLAERARLTPDAPALYCRQRAAEASYAALAADCAQRAASLQAMALPAGTLIALAAAAPELAQGLLASQWAGHPFLPLDPATADARWPSLAAGCAIAPCRLQQAPEAATAGIKPDNCVADCAPDSPALVVATSGSEGTPKGVLLPHAALLAAAEASATRLPLQAGDVWLDCLPLHHIGGLAIFWRCFAAGAAVRLHAQFDADAVWADLAEGRASHVSLVPAMLSRLLDIADGRAPPPRLRCVLIGGAALSRPLWQRARAAGWPLCVSYGMSETAAQIATLLPTDDWQEGLVGQPLPGVELAVGDDRRIRVRGRQRMLGYLGGAVLAADDWLLTGDLGSIDDDGRLHVLGRADDMLVSAGVNLHPAEIEARLLSCPGVSDAAVTATVDPVWGDVVTALVVGSATPEALAAWCREHLPATMRPRRVVPVAALPRTALGKLERHRLPELLAATLEVAT